MSSFENPSKPVLGLIHCTPSDGSRNHNCLSFTDLWNSILNFLESSIYLNFQDVMLQWGFKLTSHFMFMKALAFYVLGRNMTEIIICLCRFRYQTFHFRSYFQLYCIINFSPDPNKQAVSMCSFGGIIREKWYIQQFRLLLATSVFRWDAFSI